MDSKQNLIFALSFIVLTVVGTLTHEVGHIIPAKILGYKTTLHYGSMNWEHNYTEYTSQLRKKYGEVANAPESEIAKLQELITIHRKDALIILLGGPVQTLCTGFLGLFLLYRQRSSLKKTPFGLSNWIAVFLALFWSRQVFNLIVRFTKHILNSKNSMFGGDEANISKLLNLPTGTIGIGTGIVGALICAIVVFKVVPVEYRLRFVLSGIIGSVIGYLMWFELIGPILLP